MAAKHKMTVSTHRPTAVQVPQNDARRRSRRFLPSRPSSSMKPPSVAFSAAIHAAPIWILSLVVLLQIVALIARTEAWHVCVRATGATVAAAAVVRAAGVGYLASV